MIELKVEAGEIIVPMFVPGPSHRMDPSPDAALPPRRAFPYLGLANSRFGEPALGPLKAAFRVVERAPAPPRLDLRPLIAGRHAKLVERTRAERYTCVIDIPTQLFAGQKRLRCWRGYWL